MLSSSSTLVPRFPCLALSLLLPRSTGFVEEDLPPPPLPRPRPPCDSVLFPRVSRLKRAKCFSQDQGRAQTPNGTGDPREWRPSQTNRIPVSIPLRCRRRLRREFPSAQPCRRRYCYPACPSLSSPRPVSTLSRRPSVGDHPTFPTRRWYFRVLIAIQITRIKGKRRESSSCNSSLVDILTPRRRRVLTKSEASFQRSKIGS